MTSVVHSVALDELLLRESGERVAVDLVRSLNGTGDRERPA